MTIQQQREAFLASVILKVWMKKKVVPTPKANLQPLRPSPLEKKEEDGRTNNS